MTGAEEFLAALTDDDFCECPVPMAAFGFRAGHWEFLHDLVEGLEPDPEALRAAGFTNVVVCCPQCARLYAEIVAT